MPETNPSITDQIAQEKIDARKWYAEHESELPATGFRGMGDDKYTEYLRKAYSKSKGGKLRRASYGGQDTSPESVLSNLLEDAGSLTEYDSRDGITSAAEYNLRQRDDAAIYVSTENGYRKAGVIERLVNRFGEAISAYFQHCIDRTKCRDIEITIYGNKGTWKLKPAIVKKWALAVEQWILSLQMPLEEKAEFLGHLRQAVEAERKEIAWRLAYPETKSDRWEELFADSSRLWWEKKRPQIPDEQKIPDWLEWALCLAGKKSQRWILIAGPVLSGRMLPENPLPIAKIKELSGGSWQKTPAGVNSHYMQSFGIVPIGPDSPAYDFVREQISKRPIFRADDLPLPPFADKPTAKLVIKPESRTARESQDMTADERRADKRRRVENGLIRLLDSDLPDKEKRELVRITDLFRDGNTVKEIARRTKLSERTITTRLQTLRENARVMLTI